MRRWTRTLRRRGGGRQQRLLALLVAQVDAALEGTALASATCGGEHVPADASQAMTTIEHEGDAARAQVVDELSRSLITPIDREDIFRFSRSIDDVLDNLRDFLAELTLFAVDEPEHCKPSLEAVRDTLRHLRSAAQALLGDQAACTRHTLAAKKAANQVRRSYQQQLAELFAGHLDMEVLKRRELLRRLDVVGLRLGEAADGMADGLIKRSA